MQGILCRYSGEERKQDSGIHQASVGGGQGRGTADDGELLSPFTGGRQQNSRGCQTVLARRDAPAGNKGLCPYRKNPRLCRGVPINKIRGNHDYEREKISTQIHTGHRDLSD